MAIAPFVTQAQHFNHYYGNNYVRVVQQADDYPLVHRDLITKRSMRDFLMRSWFPCINAAICGTKKYAGGLQVNQVGKLKVKLQDYAMLLGITNYHGMPHGGCMWLEKRELENGQKDFFILVILAESRYFPEACIRHGQLRMTSLSPAIRNKLRSVRDLVRMTVLHPNWVMMLDNGMSQDQIFKLQYDIAIEIFCANVDLPRVLAFRQGQFSERRAGCSYFFHCFTLVRTFTERLAVNDVVVADSWIIKLAMYDMWGWHFGLCSGDATNAMLRFQEIAEPFL